MTERLGSGRFYGTTLRRMRLAGAVVTETSYAPGVVLPRHVHERPYFCVVLRGAFTERLQQRVQQRDTHSVVFHPAGEPHADAFEAGAASCLNIELDVDALDRVGGGAAVPHGPLAVRGGPLQWIALRLHHELVERDDVSALAAEGWLLALLAESSRVRRRPERGPRWLTDVRARLHDRFAEPPTHAELAEAAGVHPVSLARAFRRATGSSVGDYVRRLRIEHACRELDEGDGDLAALALACGFSSQSNFTRAFRRMTGTTPAAYRARSRG